MWVCIALKELRNSRVHFKGFQIFPECDDNQITFKYSFAST